MDFLDFIKIRFVAEKDHFISRFSESLNILLLSDRTRLGCFHQRNAMQCNAMQSQIEEQNIKPEVWWLLHLLCDETDETVLSDHSHFFDLFTILIEPWTLFLRIETNITRILYLNSNKYKVDMQYFWSRHRRYEFLTWSLHSDTNIIFIWSLTVSICNLLSVNRQQI